jgi:hypothetical protein
MGKQSLIGNVVRFQRHRAPPMRLAVLPLDHLTGRNTRRIFERSGQRVAPAHAVECEPTHPEGRAAHRARVQNLLRERKRQNADARYVASLARRGVDVAALASTEAFIGSGTTELALLVAARR